MDAVNAPYPICSDAARFSVVIENRPLDALSSATQNVKITNSLTSMVIFASVIMRFQLLLFPLTGALVAMTIRDRLLNDPAADQPHCAAVAEFESVAPYAKEE